MKYRTETRERTVMHGPAGQERPVVETYEVRIPIPPRDWDVIATRAAAGLVLALTLVAIAWSTVSIGALLGGGIGYAAAAIFDVAWLINVLLEWLARFTPKKRKFPRILGWALLAVTMIAIGWHGVLVGSIPLAVVGALVSLFAKILWLGIMRHIDRDLSPRDQAWVDAETSAANATLALASVRRQVARNDARAALELLAAEETRRGFSGWAEETEPVRAYPESGSDGAVEPRRRGAISPAGEGADIRSDLPEDDVNGAEDDADIRPESLAIPRPIRFRAAAVEDAPEDEPEDDDQPRMSLAGAVRYLVGQGVTAPKVVAAAASALTGREANPDSVAREIRAARARSTSTADAERGPYL